MQHQILLLYMRKIFNSKKRELRVSSWELKRCKIGERVMLSI